MKRNWDTEELIEHFSIRQEEANWLSGRSASNQLGAREILYQYRFCYTESIVELFCVSYD